MTELASRVSTGRRPRRGVTAALLCVVALSIAARAGALTVQDVASARIDGAAPGDTAGTAVLWAGDVNGDGQQDVLVDGHLFFGPLAGTTNLGAADVVFENIQHAPGYSGAEFTAKVGAAGDLNHDGFDDVVFGAIDTSLAEWSVTVIFGAPTLPSTIDVANPGAAGILINGVGVGVFIGFPPDIVSTVSGVGDINGDGIDDLAIGAPGSAACPKPCKGAVHVVYGSASLPGSIDLAQLQGAQGFSIDVRNTRRATNAEVSRIGDVNGDGIADLAVGLPYWGVRPAYLYGKGAAFVVFGRSASATPFKNFPITQVNGQGGFRIMSKGGAMGYLVAGLGDFNGDGFGDLSVSGIFHGSTDLLSWIVLGSTKKRTVLLREQSVIARKTAVIAHAPYCGRIGDFNHDSFDDLAFADDYDPPGFRGYAGLFFGSAAAGGDSDPLLYQRFTGVADGDHAGASFDGRDGQLLVGAPGADNNGTDSGSVYLIPGP